LKKNPSATTPNKPDTCNPNFSAAKKVKYEDIRIMFVYTTESLCKKFMTKTVTIPTAIPQRGPPNES